MVDISEVFVETSLITSIVIDPKASYLVGYSAEELHQMIDIPLEGGLLGVQVCGPGCGCGLLGLWVWLVRSAGMWVGMGVWLVRIECRYVSKV